MAGRTVFGAGRTVGALAMTTHEEQMARFRAGYFADRDCDREAGGEGARILDLCALADEGYGDDEISAWLAGYFAALAGLQLVAKTDAW